MISYTSLEIRLQWLYTSVNILNKIPEKFTIVDDLTENAEK